MPANSTQIAKSAAKRAVQLTFDDFSNIKVVGPNTAANDSKTAANIVTDEEIKENDEPIGVSGDADTQADLEIVSEKESKKNNKRVSHDSKTPATSTIPDKERRVKKQAINGNGSTNSGATKKVDVSPLTECIWSSNVPIASETYDLESYHNLEDGYDELFSLLRSKPLPYAGKIMKIMSLIDKLTYFFDPSITNLSFQDIEEGLGFVVNENMTDEQLQLLQDKMDLILYTLLKMLSTPANKSIVFTPPTMAQLKNNNRPYAKMFSRVRTLSTTMEWGYPLEWRYLTPEENPINTQRLSSLGLTLLLPADRLTLLSCLVDWTFSYAPSVSSEIFRLSHIRDETGFAVTTFSAPRFTEKSIAEIEKEYFNLCKMEREKYETRWKRRHSYTSGNYARKFEVFKDIQTAHQTALLAGKPSSSHEQIDVKCYKKWQEIFENEIIDDLLTNPYKDEKYKLRALEGLLARTKNIGEIYLPRLCTYKTEFMKELKTFESVEEVIRYYKYKEERLVDRSVDELKEQSSRFKLIYFDKIKLLDDMVNNYDTTEGIYYYELANGPDELSTFSEKLLSFGQGQPLERDMNLIADTVNKWSKLSTKLDDARNKKPNDDKNVRRLRTRGGLRSTFAYHGDDVEVDSASEYEDDFATQGTDNYDEFEYDDNSIIEDQTESRSERLKRRKQRNI
ncbi:Esc8p RNJ42_05145 [Nakaseomyces bracarensis]|uniref:Esc8p n=1 Tax=Nakaseomyces bracarensis TaxID=273131 RepID=UPI003872269F